MKYRKKPVVVEAIQYQREKNIGEILNFVNDGSLEYDPEKNEYYIQTLEGNMYLSKGDFIIKGVNGEFYPCKPNIFKKTYEKVEE